MCVCTNNNYLFLCLSGQKGFMFRTNTMGTQPQRSVSPKSPCKQKQKQQQTLLDDVIYDLGNATKLSQRYKQTAIILSFCAYHLCHRVVVALDKYNNKLPMLYNFTHTHVWEAYRHRFQPTTYSNTFLY